MIKNMSNMDRGIRIFVAAVIAILYFSGMVAGTLGIVLLVLAAVFLITSSIAFCPLYVPLKISTRKS